MAVIYGWTYAEFHANVGWDKGTATEYDFWENYWANKINSYIFNVAGSLLTDANEIFEIQTLVNNKMVLTNLYLKGEHNETPIATGFYANPFALDFFGDPTDNFDRGSGDYIILNKYKTKYGEELTRVDRIRMGVDPDDFPIDKIYY